MGDVDRIFDEYRQAYADGGDGDPEPFVARLSGAERAELEALIDGFLMHGPGRPWDAEAFAGSPASRLVDAVERSWLGEAGWWPELLPRLRKRAKLTRPQLASRLAETLDVSEKTEKVSEYYGAMEQGSLPAAGVSSRVLGALGEILGATAAALREAGAALPDVAPPPATGAAFARKALADPEYATETDELADVLSVSSRAGAEPRSRAQEPGWDEVDELFRGTAD